MDHTTIPASDIPTRLARQMAFIMEADKLKTILRRNRVVSDPTRRENDAEHMYHFALMVVVLSEHANAPIDVLRVLKMVLIHDAVEIDAGDVFIYDAAAAVGKREREEKAATRIFGLLPDDQQWEMRGLWEEFEAEETPEARFAAALDRLQPLLCNYHSQGGAWKEYGIAAPQVFERNAKIARGSEALWAYASDMLSDAVAKGYLAKSEK